LFYRPIYYASDDEEEEYPIDELADLEEQAAIATPEQQGLALVQVTTVLDASNIPNGAMGGYNFWNRGSLRRTTDVDIAVNRAPSMETILGLFNDDPLLVMPQKVSRISCLLDLLI
jgi:hypothetical protein